MAKMSKVRSRGPTAVDTHVGQKIRARRMYLQLSQTEVADALGISFQQIQKYEKGTNRVGASRLQEISNTLGVSPFYFFEGAPTAGKKAAAPDEGELPENIIVSFLGTREGAALVRGFLSIKEKSIRQNLIAFIASVKSK
jgi:transcriptional regulator with XRE-family HTH domain